MSLIRYDPFKGIRDFTQGVNSLNNIFDTYEYPKMNMSSFTPSVNIRDGKFAYHIDVDVPGLKKEEVNIHIDSNILIISGERKTKEEVNKEDYYRVESSFGNFERRFALSDDADVENIHAECSDGVLEITIPRKTPKEEHVKKVEIK